MARCVSLILFCAVVLLSVSSAGAYELADLLGQAVANHDRIKAAESNLRGSRYNVKNVRGGYYPQLSLSGDAAWQEIHRPRDAGVSSKYRNIQILRATQLLHDFGAMDARAGQAAVEENRAETQLVLVRQDLLLQGSNAYLSIVRAREKLKRADRSLESIKKQTGMEEALVERGAGLSSDVLQAKQQLAGAQALRVRVQGELERGLALFKAVFDMELSESEIEELVTPPSPEPYLPATLEQALDTAMENNLRLAQAERDIETARFQAKETRSRFLPRFTLFLEGRREENDDGISGLRTETVAGIEFSWNLFSGGSEWSAMKAAGAREDMAMNQRADLRRSVEEQVRSSWREYMTQKKNAALLENQENILGEFLDLARKERRMATRSLLSVLNAEVNYINAGASAVSAEIDKMLAAYGVLHAMGELDLDAFR